MRQLAADSSLRYRLGSDGMKHIQENFLWEKKAEYYSALYHQILRSRIQRSAVSAKGYAEPQEDGGQTVEI